MTYHLKKTVALIGMMGAGKTAVGKALSAKLGVPFVDSDAEIELAANMTIAEIFSRDGEPFFRRKESQVIERLLNSAPVVLSTGGGAFMAESNRMAISTRGISIFLNADLDTLWNRVKHKDSRPLLRSANPYQTLSDLLDKRRPVYALADMMVPSDADVSVDEMATRVIQSLLSRPDVLEEVS